MEVALRQAGADPDDLELLVVTHSHADHRGLAAEVVRRTGCTLAMGKAPHPILDVLRDPGLPLDARRARGLREGIPPVALDRFVDDLPGSDGVYPAVEPDRILATGERVESRSGGWQVVPAPGHSGDQIALWNAGTRELISADLALPGPASYLEYGTRPDPHADQLASLDRVIALEPEVVLAGHGRPIGDGVTFLRGCREKAVGRVQAVRAALGDIATQRVRGGVVDYARRRGLRPLAAEHGGGTVGARAPRGPRSRELERRSGRHPPVDAGRVLIPSY